MPSKPFSELLIDPRFKELPDEQKSDLVSKYWSKFEADQPGLSDLATKQREAGLQLIQLNAQRQSGSPVDRQLTELPLRDAIKNIGLTEELLTGKIDEAGYREKLDAYNTERKSFLNSHNELVSSLEASRTEGQRRSALLGLIGTGGEAKSMAGASPGVVEGFKDFMNERSSPNAGAVEALMQADGDPQAARDYVNEKLRSSKKESESIATALPDGVGARLYSARKQQGEDRYGNKTISVIDSIESALDSQGISGDDRKRVLSDTAKSYAWTKDSTDRIRKLSTGELAINPASVFGNREELVKEIESSDTTQSHKNIAVAKLDALRRQMAPDVFGAVDKADENFSKFASEIGPRLGYDETATLDAWSKAQGQRGAWAKSWDVLGSAFINGSAAIAKTVTGTTAGISSNFGSDLGLETTLNLGKKAEQRQAAQKLRGLTGNYELADEVGTTIVQMAPMFAGGPITLGSKTALAGLVRGMAVYGTAGLQGLESKYWDALEIEKRKIGRDLTEDEAQRVLADPKTQVAAFANGVQTAALAKVLGGGAEAAALGKTASSMTVRDFLAGGGLAALRDKTLKKELGALSLNLFKHGGDEFVEEGLNQVADNLISVGVLGETLKLGDLITESFKAASMGFAIGGGVSQFQSGTTHDKTNDEVESVANAAAVALAKNTTQENLPPSEAAGGTQQAPSDAGVAPREQMTRSELEAVVAEERATLSSREADTLSEEEKQTLAALEGTPEEIAQRFGIEITQDEQNNQTPAGETNASQALQLPPVPTGEAAPTGPVEAGGPAQASAPTETKAETPLISEPAKAPSNTTPTPQQNEEVQRQGQGRQEVLTPTEVSPAPSGETSTSPEISRAVVDAKENDVDLRVGEDKSGITLFGVNVQTDQRRQGKATAAITSLQRVADEKQIPITLTVEPSPEMSKPALIDWYSKLGFELQPDGDTMVYAPAKSAPTALVPNQTVTYRGGTGVVKYVLDNDNVLVSFPDGDGQFEMTVRADELTPISKTNEDQIQKTSSPAPVEGKPAVAEAKGKTQEGVAQRKSQSQKDLLNAPIEEIAKAAIENPNDVNAALLVFAAAGVRPASLPEQKQEPKVEANGQLRLFQGEETLPIPEAEVPSRSATKTEEAGGLSYAELEAHPTALRKIVNKLRTHKVFRAGTGTFKQAAKRIMNQMVSNILKIHDMVPEDIRNQSKLWYSGANRISHRWSKQFGVSTQAVAGTIAAMSPQKDWFQNVSLAERLLSIWTGQGRETDTVNEEMRDAARKMDDAQTKAAKGKGYLVIEGEEIPLMAHESRLNQLMGKNFDELATEDKAFFVRLYDSTYNDPSYALVSPEGRFGKFHNNRDGSPTRIAWGSNHEVSKAIRILEDPSVANISVQLGKAHKIRSFYNNIINPESDETVTSDTHAVAAAYLLPLSGASMEVSHNFGGTGSGSFKGTYAFVAEAYRRAAAARGIKPSQMQSITWEAIREIFTATAKRNESTVAKIRKLWDDYSRGKTNKTYEQTANEAIKAGGGYSFPAWYRQSELGFGDSGTAFDRDTTFRSKRGITGTDGLRAGKGRGDGRRSQPARQRPQGGAEQGTLFQSPEDSVAKGTYTPKAAAKAATVSRAMIGLLEGKSDASTGIHEAGHAVEDFLREIGEGDKADALEAWAKENVGDDWRKKREYIARGFERFVVNGVKTGVEAVDRAFARIAEIMLNIYKSVKGSSIDIDIPPHIEKIFNELLSRGAELEAAGKKPVTLPVDVVKTPAKPAPNSPAQKVPAPTPKSQRKLRLPEFVKPTPSTRGVNAEMDAELSRLGMAPVADQARQALPEVWEDVMSNVSADPSRGSNLVKALLVKPRPVDTIEQGVLLHEYASRKIAYGRAQERVIRAAKAGQDIGAASAELAQAEAALRDVVEASKKAGSEWGRSGRFRQIQIDEDFSPEAMSMRYSSVIKGGQPLTAEESESIRELSNKIKELNDEIEALSHQVRTQERIMGEQQSLIEVEREARKEAQRLRVKAPASSKREAVKKVLSTPAQSARDFLAKAGFQRLSQEAERIRRAAWVDRSGNITELKPGQTHGDFAADLLGGKSIHGTQELNNKGWARVVPTGDTLYVDFGETAQSLSPAQRRQLIRLAENSGMTSITVDGYNGQRVVWDNSDESQTLYQHDEPAPLPTEILDAFASVGAEYIANGITNLKAFRAQLLEEFGPEAVPHAKDIMRAAQAKLKNSASKIKGPRTIEQIKADLDPEAPELTRDLVFNMAKAAWTLGYRGTDILDYVTEQLQEDLPDVTREQVADAFTGYGKVKLPSKDEMLVELRELRNIERIQRQIDDVMRGELPKKTGQQRDKPTTAILKLQEELKAAMKRAGMDTVSDETRLRGPLDAVKTRFKNRAKLLREALDTHEKLPPKSRGVNYNAEANALKEEVARLQEEYDAVFGEKSTLTDAQREQRVIGSLTRQIDLEKRLAAEGKLRREKGDTAPDTPAVKALRAELRSLVEDRHARAKALVNTMSPEEKALLRAEAAIERTIAKNEEILRTGKLPSKRGVKKYTPSEYLTKRREHLKSLTKQVAQLRRASQPRLSPEERARRVTIQSLERAIDTLRRNLSVGNIASRPRTTRPTNDPEIARLRAEHDALKGKLKELRDLARPKITPEERSLRASKARLDKRISDVRQRLRNGDFAPPLKKKAPATDAEIARKQVELNELMRQWNEGFLKAELAKRGLTARIVDGIAEAVNVSRAIMTSGDFSAMFRQGGFAFMGHPVLGMKAFAKSLPATFSEARMKQLSNRIEGNRHFALGQQAGLYLADRDTHTLAKMEEAFRSRLARKGWLGKYLVNPSERAYTAFLNQIRMDLFSQIVDGMGGATVEQAKVVADFVNKATGRGNLGDSEMAAKALATVFFSPKFVVSRFQLLSGMITTPAGALLAKDADIRKVKRAITWQYARSIIGIAAVYTALSLAKAGYEDKDEPFTIEDDPRSSNFGKIKFGKTTIDFMGGLLQAVTFLARVATVETITSKGKQVDLTKPKYGSDSLMSVIGKFLQSKLAPGVGTTVAAWGRKDFKGDPTTPEAEVVGSMLPLPVGDIYAAMREHGFVKGLPLSLLSMIGMGVSVRNDKVRPIEQEITIGLGLDKPRDFKRK